MSEDDISTASRPKPSGIEEGGIIVNEQEKTKERESRGKGKEQERSMLQISFQSPPPFSPSHFCPSSPGQKEFPPIG